SLCVSCVLLFFFFFFQAEDGIRDGHVTGVQTCALPISPWPASCKLEVGAPSTQPARRRARGCCECSWASAGVGRRGAAVRWWWRSEERRVGKEGRGRGGGEGGKKRRSERRAEDGRKETG